MIEYEQEIEIENEKRELNREKMERRWRGWMKNLPWSDVEEEAIRDWEWEWVLQR